jgi:hypothetical protein
VSRDAALTIASLAVEGKLDSIALRALTDLVHTMPEMVSPAMMALQGGLGPTLLEHANKVASGEQTSAKLAEEIEGTTGMSRFGLKRMLWGDVVPWSVPGWGIARYAISRKTDGKIDPFSKRPIHFDFWRHGLMGWGDALMGAVTVGALVIGVKGAAATRVGLARFRSGNLPTAIADEGARLLSGRGRALAYLPGTTQSRFATGLAKFDDVGAGIAKLDPDGSERANAELAYNAWKNGDLLVESDAGVKVTPWGMWSDTRGAIPVVNRNRPMYEFTTRGGRPVLRLSSRARGEELGAIFAAVGTRLRDGATSRAAVREATEAAEQAVTRPLTKHGHDLVEHNEFARAAAQIGIGADSKVGPAGKMRPGLYEDAVNAVANPWSEMSPSTYSRKQNWQKFRSSPSFKPVVIGVPGAAVSFLGYKGYKMFTAPPPPPEEGAATDQQAAASNGQTQAPSIPSTGDPEVDAAIQSLLTMAPEQQEAWFGEQIAALEAASKRTDLTEEDTQALLKRKAQLETIVTVFSGDDGATG